MILQRGTKYRIHDIKKNGNEILETKESGVDDNNYYKSK